MLAMYLGIVGCASFEPISTLTEQPSASSSRPGLAAAQPGVPTYMRDGAQLGATERQFLVVPGVLVGLSSAFTRRAWSAAVTTAQQMCL
jgi:hypothetical protein